MRHLTGRIIGALLALLLALPAAAQDFAALARVDPGRSALVSQGDGARLTLALSRAVPWRVYTLEAPRRAVLEARTLDLAGLGPDALGPAGPVRLAGAGQGDDGWSRITLALDAPLEVRRAGMATGADGPGAMITLDLRPVSAEAFAASAGPPPGVARLEREATAVPASERDGRLRVMLDPGHGGRDPGAVHGGAREGDITLATARALREALRRDGRFDVAMTRDADVFVTLESRIAAARDHRADLFLSIHADAVPEGVARGAQVWTLSEEASSRAGELLAERHNRADLLGGADLTGQDDAVAAVLMDIARTETAPRSDALADALVEGLRKSGIRLHRRPRESAGFAVLRAPDIPSVLVEIGFMSSPGELALLTSPQWRLRVAEGLARGVADWVDRDAARAALGLR